MDYDLAATAQARSKTATTTRERCGTCGKVIYKQTPYPGVPVEWHHASSGKPVGYTPREHIASLTRTEKHQHRFMEPEAVRDECAYPGCGAEMHNPKRAPVRSEPEVNPDSRAAREAVSRRRGAAASAVRVRTVKTKTKTNAPSR